MMLTRRGGGVRTDITGAGPSSRQHGRPVSRAQYTSAVLHHPRFQRTPTNRLIKPTFDSSSSSYNQYENTSPERRSTCRSSDDVVFPPVQMKIPAARGRPSSARRPANNKRGPRKLPTVGKDGAVPRIAWYHEDGSVNLQALSYLVNKHSFPRTQAYYDRLERMKNRPWPPDVGPSRSLDDDGLLLPLQFVDDDQLTPRKRAEQESLLNLLLSADDLMTEQELEEIVKYISSDQPDGESMPRSCLKKSPRPHSGAVEEKKKKRSRQRNSQGSSKSKSVCFQHASSLTDMSNEACRASPPESPRPQSAPNPPTEFSSNPLQPARRSSDPFHVASPALSPRFLGSPDEVAYFHDLESHPEVPASPELVPEPKITYYDESGEEIEEEIQTNEWSRVEDRATSCEECLDESPPSESGVPPVSPLPEEDLPEHLSEQDTPRVNLDTVDIQESPQSRPQSVDSASPRPRGHILSESSDSPNQPVSPRTASPRDAPPDAPAEQQCADAPPKDEDTSSEPKEDTPDSAENEKSSPTTPPETPRPGLAPAAEQSSRPSKKSRPKSSSSKRHKSSRSRSKSAAAEEAAQQSSPSTEGSNEHKSQRHRKRPDTSPITRPSPPEPSTEGNNEQKSQRHRKRPDTSPITRRPPPERSEPAKEEPHPIPVISLTRGQLASIPPYSPRIQSADCPDLDPCPKDLADSVQCQRSPGSSTLRGAESESFSDGPGTMRGGGKDNRMKIWLTKTDWGRQVEIVD